MQHRALSCSASTPHLAMGSAIFAKQSCPCFKGALMFYLLLPTALSPFLPLSFSFFPCHAWVEGRAYRRALHVLRKYSVSYTPNPGQSLLKQITSVSSHLHNVSKTSMEHSLSISSVQREPWTTVLEVSFSKMGRVYSSKGSAVLRIFKAMCYICYLLYVYHQESCSSCRQYTTPIY